MQSDLLALSISIFLFSYMRTPASVVTFSLFMQDKSLSSGLFFLDLLGAVEPRVVNWSLVTRGMTGRFKSFTEFHVGFVSFWEAQIKYARVLNGF